MSRLEDHIFINWGWFLWGHLEPPVEGGYTALQAFIGCKHPDMPLNIQLAQDKCLVDFPIRFTPLHRSLGVLSSSDKKDPRKWGKYSQKLG